MAIRVAIHVKTSKTVTKKMKITKILLFFFIFYFFFLIFFFFTTRARSKPYVTAAMTSQHVLLKL